MWIYARLSGLGRFRRSRPRWELVNLENTRVYFKKLRSIPARPSSSLPRLEWGGVIVEYPNGRRILLCEEEELQARQVFRIICRTLQEGSNYLSLRQIFGGSAMATEPHPLAGRNHADTAFVWDENAMLEQMAE